MEAQRARLAMLPPENLTGAALPLREVTEQVENALARAGIEVVAGEAVERYLHRHRIRYTAGIDGADAAAAREDLGVDGILVTWVEVRGEGPPPRISLAMRVVRAADPAEIVWIDTVALTGDDHPGFLGLGRIGTLRELERMAFDRLGTSLGEFLDGKAPRSSPCGRARSPGRWHRSPDFEKSHPTAIVVLPFANHTSRRGAGEVVALQLARQIMAVPGLQVLEPGVVREELLRHRVIMQEGPSVDDLLVLGATVRPDIVIAGQVLEYDEGSVARLGVSVVALDVRARRVIWRSGTQARGTDGVWFFDDGLVALPTELACQISRGVVDRMLAGMGAQPPVSPPASSPAPTR